MFSGKKLILLGYLLLILLIFLTSATAEYETLATWAVPWPEDKAFLLTQGFDGTYSHNHGLELDFGLYEGVPVFAPTDGEVVLAGWDTSGYGLLVKIQTDEAFILLAHLSEIVVEVDDTLERGDLIGYSGSTGNVKPHLHFEVRPLDDAYDNDLSTEVSILFGLPIESFSDSFYNITSLVGGTNKVFEQENITGQKIDDTAFFDDFDLKKNKTANESASLPTDNSNPVNIQSSAESDFTWNGTTITGYQGTGGDVVIPEKATSIGEFAFRNNESIVSIIIPGSIKTIDRCAFQSCKNLQSIVIYDGLTDIKDFAISYCESLTFLSLPDSVENIENGAFCYNELLMDFHLPANLSKLGGSAFSGCRSLTNIIIPDGLEKIGHGAFSHCDNLLSITIPSSVVSMDAAFTWSEAVTIYGYNDTAAERFASKSKTPFVSLGDSLAN